MTNPIITIHNVETGEIINREMTNEEYSAYKIEQEEIKKAQVLEDEKTKTKAELLERLGITEEEAKLLLG